MRRSTVLVFAVSLLAAIGAITAGCGGQEDLSTAPDTVVGTVAAPVQSELPAGDPAAGEAVFASAGCGGCHTLAAAGATGNVGPNLDESKPPVDLVVSRVTDGAGVMPPFKDSLDDQQIADVAAYVVQSTGG